MAPPAKLHMIQASFGDTLLLENPKSSGSVFWLIDGGPGPVTLPGSWQYAVYSLFYALNTLGVSFLEKLIVTHNDSDHTKGILVLLKSLGDPKLKNGAFKDFFVAFVKEDRTSWKNGYRLLNTVSPPNFPIGNFWFNDRQGVLANYFPSVSRSPGWLERAIAIFKEAYPTVDIPTLNEEWGSTGFPVVVNSVNPHVSNIALYAPDNKLLKKLRKYSDKDVKWKVDQDAFGKRGSATPSSVDISKWNKIDQGKKSRDQSVQNKSSIMFQYKDDNNRAILLTGDSAGPILDAAINAETTWGIMKVMHHGSSRNCYINGNSDLNKACHAFFAKYKADKYCISGDTFAGNPNPDAYTCIAIVNQASVANKGQLIGPNSREPFLYFTNGMSIKTYTAMLGTGKQFRVFFLTRESYFGTVVNSTDEKGEVGWTRMVNENVYFKYFTNGFGITQQVLESAKTGKISPPPKTAKPRKRKTVSNKKKVKPKGKKPRKPVATLLAALVATAAPPVVSAIAPTSRGPNTSQDWHNLVTSGLLSSDLEDPTDFDDTPVPDVTPAQSVVEDGNTAQWVDLATFILYVAKNASLAKPDVTPSGLTDDLLAPLKLWYTSGSTDPVLASMLLPALIGADDSVAFYSSLPLNANGSKSSTDDLDALSGLAAIMNMTIQNFRARIVVPTQAQFSSGSCMQVLAYYFELNPPPAGWNAISDAEFFTWTVPFQNALWTHGQLTFQHQGPLRVKIAWPQFTNCVVFVHFDSTMSIGRGTAPITFPCRGSMVAPSGSPATYDIKLKGDANGSVGLLQIYEAFAPQNSVFFDVFGNILKEIDIPGIDIKSLITEGLQLSSPGITLFQTQLFFPSVSVEQIYGTIPTSQVLQLAANVLQAPRSLVIPSSLPPLTVSFGNVVASESNSISLSFSYPVADIGLVGFEITHVQNLSTRFDIWLSCNDGVSVATILDKLGFGNLTAQYEAARVFSEGLSGLSVPYVHLALGRKDAQSFGVTEFGIVIQIADFGIPPVISMQNFQLVLQHGSPSDTKTQQIQVHGSAVLTIAGIDALCTFTIDPTEEGLVSFLDTSNQGFVDEDDQGPAPGETSGPTGYSGSVAIQVTFPGECPSVSSVISHFVGDLADAAGLGVIRQCVPNALSAVFDGVAYKEFQFTLSKNADTSNKWALSQVSAQLDLDGLQDALNIFAPAVTFKDPLLYFEVDNPTSSSRSYTIIISSTAMIAGVLCDVSAVFSNPPHGLTQDSNAMVRFTIQTDPMVPGLPVGSILQNFIGKGLDQLDIDPTKFTPSKVVDVLHGLDANNIILGFANVATDSNSHNFKLRNVEATVLSGADPWKPFENVQISDVQLHIAHNTGVAPSSSTQTSASTQISFDATLTVGPTVLETTFVHDSSNDSWTLTLAFLNQRLDLVRLITDCINGIGLTIPDSVATAIQSILTIDVTSFSFSYAAGDQNSPKTIQFSQDGDVSLFGIHISMIQVICEKSPSSSKWNYTVALALPSPCFPLDGFSKSTGIPIPGLGGIQVNDGHFSISNVQTSSVITKVPIPSDASSSSVCLSGRLLLGGSQFMDLIHTIIQISEVDINILPGLVKILIPVGSGGLNILNVFKVNSFDLQIVPDGFGLGADLDLDCDWLSKEKINCSFTLLVKDDGAFGASIEITTDIIEPFHLPGIVLTKAGFSLVWLAEAEEPQSLSAHAGIKISAAGADDISGSFALSVDELNPNNDFYNMHIQNLTLANVVKAMTHGSLPSPLDSSFLRLGFKNLDVDLKPKSLDFSYNADIYFFALEGKVVVEAHVATGLSFAANLNPVDILGLIKIHAFDNNTTGPFIFLDTTVKDIISNNTGPPPWLGVTTSQDPRLKGAVFALSAKMVFLGDTMAVYGVINVNEGLMLIIEDSEALPSAPGTSFKFSEAITIVINVDHFKADTAYMFSFGLNLPDISVFGISLGQYNGTVVDLDGDFTLTVKYAGASWKQDEVVFFVMVHVDALGLSFTERADLDITLGSLNDVPGQIESFVEHKFVDFLKDKLAKPFVEGFEKAKELANKAASVLAGGFNAAEEDVVHGLLEAGHDIEAVADALKNELNMGIDEVAGALTNFGHDVTQVGDAIGSAFNAAPQEVASALISAGVTVEHALEHAFGDVAGELGKDFNLVGSSIASFGEDAVDAIGNFVTGDVKHFLSDAVSDLGDFLSGAGNAFVSFFKDTCEIM